MYKPYIFYLFPLLSNCFMSSFFFLYEMPFFYLGRMLPFFYLSFPVRDFFSLWVLIKFVSSYISLFWSKHMVNGVYF